VRGIPESLANHQPRTLAQALDDLKRSRAAAVRTQPPRRIDCPPESCTGLGRAIELYRRLFGRKRPTTYQRALAVHVSWATERSSFDG
jgi:hypothetical protein